MYCFVDDGKGKEVLGIVCFKSKEDVANAYLNIVKELCNGRKAVEVFEIKGDKVELKGSKLDRKGIEFCHLLSYFCSPPNAEALVSKLRGLGVKVLVIDNGLFSNSEIGVLRKELKCKVMTRRSHLRRGGPLKLCGLRVEFSWESFGVQLADLAARCCSRSKCRRMR